MDKVVLYKNWISNSSLRSLHIDRMWKLDTPPKNIYIAASISEEGQMVAMRVALELVNNGFNVVSRWLTKDFSKRATVASGWREYVSDQEKCGAEDLEDLAKADTLILLSGVESTSGGYHVELGYFLGAGKTNIIVIGRRCNVFYWGPDIRWAANADNLVLWLKDYRNHIAAFEEKVGALEEPDNDEAPDHHETPSTTREALDSDVAF